MAYDTLEPIGEVRGDFRAGLIASTIANVNRRKGSRALTPQEFMPIQKQQEMPVVADGEMDPLLLKAAGLAAAINQGTVPPARLRRTPREGRR